MRAFVKDSFEDAGAVRDLPDQVGQALADAGGRHTEGKIVVLV